MSKRSYEAAQAEWYNAKAARLEQECRQEAATITDEALDEAIAALAKRFEEEQIDWRLVVHVYTPHTYVQGDMFIQARMAVYRRDTKQVETAKSRLYGRDMFLTPLFVGLALDATLVTAPKAAAYLAERRRERLEYYATLGPEGHGIAAFAALVKLRAQFLATKAAIKEHLSPVAKAQCKEMWKALEKGINEAFGDCNVPSQRQLTLGEQLGEFMH